LQVAIDRAATLHNNEKLLRQKNLDAATAEAAWIAEQPLRIAGGVSRLANAQARG
jgi:hypothetical protein